MKPGLASVLMPAYNGETYIQQAIESVIAQTYPNWELIVVDDGSTDNTSNIVANYRDPRIRYDFQENRGQAAALNRGLDLARGEYITTLDTDDWFTPESLSDRVRFLTEHPEYGVVYGDGYYCDVTGKLLQHFSNYRIENVCGDVYDILITSPFFGTGANVMVRREVFEKNRIRYDEAIVWCQDYDIYIRIAEQASFGVVDTVTVWYRLHEANMTMSMPQGRRLESLIRTKFKVLNSPRFTRVATPSKINFFSQFLVYDLERRLEDQMTLIDNPYFQILPKPQQARLLRLAANHYLLIGQHIEFARDWLRRAWALAPFDPKTGSALVLAHLHPDLTKLIVKWWRQAGLREGAHQSPFEMAKESH
jgi:glycosyltransferase involved in cell wall biosynthesis